MKYDKESIERRKKNHKNIKKVIYVFIVIIVYNIILLLISGLSNMEISGIFGYKAYSITTSSMVPSINQGDAIIVQKCGQDDLKKDDIITFKKNNEFITHRIVEIRQSGVSKEYITKGDNNNVEDSQTVSYDEIEGVKVLVIPFLGNFITMAANSIFIILVLIVILLIYLYKVDSDEKSEIRREKKKIEDCKYEQQKQVKKT